MIESSLYAAAKREGVPDSVISSFVDIFGWDVDFRSDLRRGDTFRISYEAPDSSANPKLRSQRIIAAELNVRGKVWRAVYFEAEDEGGRYYSSEGGHTVARFSVTRSSSRESPRSSRTRGCTRS